MRLWICKENVGKVARKNCRTLADFIQRGFLSSSKCPGWAWVNLHKSSNQDQIQLLPRVFPLLISHLPKVSESPSSIYQGHNKLLKLGGAQRFIVLQRGQIPDELSSSPPKNRGCTCTPGTPSSYDPVYWGVLESRLHKNFDFLLCYSENSIPWIL